MVLNTRHVEQEASVMFPFIAELVFKAFKEAHLRIVPRYRFHKFQFVLVLGVERLDISDVLLKLFNVI